MSDQVDSIMADFLSDTSDAFMREIGDTESTGCDRVSESCDAYIPSPPGQETGVCDTGLGRIDLDGILVDLFSDIEAPVKCDSGVMDQMLSCLPIVGREEDTNMVLDSVKSCVPVPDPSTTPSTHTAEHQCSTAVMQQMPSCLSPETSWSEFSRGNGLTGDTSHQSLTLNPSSTPPQNTQLVESTMAQVLSSPPSPLDTTPDQQAVMTIPGSVKTCVPVSVTEHADRQVPASPDSSCTPPPLENIKLKREVTKRLGRGAHSKSIKRCTPKKPQSKKKKLFKTTEPCPVAVIECLNCSQVGTIICDDCTYILKSKLLKFQIFRTFLKTLF